MWYWLLMGALLLSMLLFMRVNKPKWITVSKLLLFIALVSSLLLGYDPDSLARMWSLAALIFFILCYGVEELAPKHNHIQLFLFSVACLFYSLDFWSQVESITWIVSIASFALVVVVFFLLLPLLDSFALPASIVALILWQLLWASGELWQFTRSLLDMSGFCRYFVTCVVGVDVGDSLF